MKRPERDRLIVSIILSLALFGLLFLVLYFIPWQTGEEPRYSGPLTVTVTVPESMRPAEPEAVPEEPAEPEPQPQPQPETTGREAAGGGEEGSGLSRADRMPARPAESRGERQAGGRENPAAAEDHPQPEQTLPGIPGSRDESDPYTSEMEFQSTFRSDDAPSESERHIREREREPRYAGEGSRTGELSDQPAGRDTEVTEEESAAPEEGILGDLAGLDEALEEGGSAAGGSGGGSGYSSDPPGSVRDLGTPESPVDIETLTSNREAISLDPPVIDASLVEGMPPVFETVISFTLLPAGYITDLKIYKDSGNTEVDSIIRNAILKWRFAPVPETAGSIQVRVRYVIRIR